MNAAAETPAVERDPSLRYERAIEIARLVACAFVPVAILLALL